MTRAATGGWHARVARWSAIAGSGLRDSRAGLFALALLVGAGAGLGAVAFRYLISGLTWLATGHAAFGQRGYAGSAHLPWLGLAFFVVIPVVGGLIYGPLIYRWSREARGHGVPEVMAAVADSGGRIRPQVSAVKAAASAVCIGTGGSVGKGRCDSVLGCGRFLSGFPAGHALRHFLGGAAVPIPGSEGGSS